MDEEQQASQLYMEENIFCGEGQEAVKGALIMRLYSGDVIYGVAGKTPAAIRRTQFPRRRPASRCGD